MKIPASQFLVRFGIAITASIACFILAHLSEDRSSMASTAPVLSRFALKHISSMSVILGISVFFATALFFPNPASATPAPASPNQEASAAHSAPFQAQVVGLAWMNPLQRQDYPTEWQLLWTLGRVKPNPHDDMVRTDPQQYSTLQSVAAIANDVEGRETFTGYFHKYVDPLLALFGTKYVMGERYFYTVHPKDRRKWREIAGIHVEIALPEKKLFLEPAAKYLQEAIMTEFTIGNKEFPNLWNRDTPPDVHAIQGGPNAGFTSLNSALDYLQSHPKETVWVMNWDAPSYPPKAQEINENMVLLILAGPDLKTDREPLAWLGRPVTGDTANFEAKAGTTRALQAWKVTIEAAAANAGKTTHDIHFTVHDAGTGSEKSSNRLGTLAQTLTEILPEFNYQQQTFNTPALLGYMGAGTASTNIALAIAYSNHYGGSTLVAGTDDAHHPVATIVNPPSVLTLIDPNAEWFRARGGDNAYLPWWGHLFEDEEGDYKIQGFSA